MSSPGGSIFSWAKGLEREMVVAGKFYCPVRTHHLQESIKAQTSRNQFGVYIYMRADARSPRGGASYAKYVHEGTYGPITAKNPRNPMVWEGWGRWAGPWKKWVVQGQGATPFLRAGMRDVLRRHHLV